MIETAVRGSIGGFASGSDDSGGRRGEGETKVVLWWLTYDEGVFDVDA